jgi:hypothetical protein
MEVFPGDAFTEKHMQGYIGELIQNGLLTEYTYNNQRFWQVTGWKHQKIEKPSFKYGPFDSSGNPMPFDDHSTNPRRPFDDSSPPEGNGEESTGVERNGRDVCELGEKSPTTPSGYSFLASDGSLVSLSQSKLDEWVEAFPGVDVPRALSKASQWLRDNPTRRKTKRGIVPFLGSWLGKDQDRASSLGKVVVPAKESVSELAALGVSE